MRTMPKRDGEKDRRGLNARSVHGEYVECNPAIRHPVRDESGVEPAIMREVLEKMMESTESDGLTESVTEENAEESPIVRVQPVKRARNGLRKYKSMVRKLKERVNDKVINPKIVKSTATTVVMSLAKVSRSNEAGQVDGVGQGGRERENQVPPMLLAGLISTASKVK